VVLVEVDLRMLGAIAVGGEGDEEAFGRLVGRLLREGKERRGADHHQEEPTRHPMISGTGSASRKKGRMRASVVSMATRRKSVAPNWAGLTGVLVGREPVRSLAPTMRPPWSPPPASKYVKQYGK